MNLMALVELLEDAGLGVKGETIFLNMMPVGARQAILLRSPLQGVPIDYELPNYYRAEFQLIVRSDNYAAGEALAAEVVSALTLTEQLVGDMRFTYCRPRTKPVSFPLSDGDLYEFSVPFDSNFVQV